MASLCLLSLCACSDEITTDDKNVNISGDDIINLSFVTEAGNGRTRAYSTGSHINQLIYMIYKKNNETGDYVLDKYFLANNTYEAQKYDMNGYPVAGSDGKKTIDYCGVLDGPPPYSIRLIRNPSDPDNQEYKIVCWAQEKDSEYFDLSEFPNKISINYSSAINNLEQLDAFYCTQKFSINDKNIVLELKRPFAQINIGTSGWDYEGFALIEPNPTIIKYSKIVIEGVAKSFSPLEQKAVKGENNSNLTTITYSWAKIPAYRNLWIADLEKVTGVYTDDHNTDLSDLGIFTMRGAQEEFLFIDLPDPNKKDENGRDVAIEGANENFQGHPGYDEKFADYIGWKTYDALCAQYSKEELKPHIFTETFKYLSMCYVLVPFVTNEETGGVTGATVNVKFDCSDGIKQSSEVAGDESDNKTDADAPTQDNGEYNRIFGDKYVFELNNVPVVSNHRTNIVATDGTGFFMNTNDLKVSIYTESFADYYKHYHPVDEEWYEELKDDPDDPNKKYHGENGGTENEGYIPPEESDYDQDLFKRPLLRDIKLENKSKYSYLPNTDKFIRAFVYLNDNGKFDNLNEDITIKVADKLYTTVGTEYKGLCKSDFYIGSSKLDASDPNVVLKSDGYYYININESLIEKYVAANSEKTLDEDYNMYYYPIEFVAKTTLMETEGVKDEYYRAPEDHIDIRLYPLYKSYTFSSKSEDGGGEIWKQIESTSGSKKSFNQYLENGNAYSAYAIDNGTSVTYGDITVKSRTGSGGNNSVAIFPARRDDTGDQADHLIIMGACNSQSVSNGVETPDNHYIKFNINKKCKITVKWGRDKDADNGGNATKMYTRNLNINWGQKDLKATDTWEPYSYSSSDTNNTYINSSGTQRYIRTESRIAPAVTTGEISGKTPVYIYEKTVSTSYYWILVSPAE